jgi:hypothetical protein
MGITPFMAIISPKASDTYVLSRQCPGNCYAIPGSGVRDAAAQRRAWVRLVVAILAGVAGPAQSRFSKCRISRMIGVMR